MMLNIFRAWLNSFRVMAPSRRVQSRRSSAFSFVADIQVLEPRALLSASFPQFVDPHPSAGDGFGSIVDPLKNGNVVVIAPGDNAGGTNAGAVYLFNGSTGALISTLIGSHAGDFTNSSITQVGNSNFVVINQEWNNGIGAVTWGSGTTGVSGTISASNSLIGSTAGDAIGEGGVTVLPNGNYLVDSYYWANGTATNAGAVTFGSSATGVHGIVSASNSLVGSSTNDKVGGISVNNVWPQLQNTLSTSEVSQVVSPNLIFNWFGSGIQVLKNGNFVVRSSEWNQHAAAVTFGSESTGITGIVSASNSLIGRAANDRIGSSGITALANGNYVVDSPLWANGSAAGAGAVTWGSGTTGVHGVVSASNSLVGSTAGDSVGSNGVIELKNGNYVVDSSSWNNGSAHHAGAVTFSNGRRGITGVVGSANSLVGSTTDDYVGYSKGYDWIVTPAVTSNVQTTSSLTSGAPYVWGSGIGLLDDGDYLVVSQNWSNGTATDAGAVTWVSGVTGATGGVSAANSLVGTTKGDEVGSNGIVGVGNGNFAVISPNWSNGSFADAGAVTFVHGDHGFKGAVSSNNSLVGGSKGDFVGSYGVAVLSNGNYLVRSPSWGAGAFETGSVSPWSSLGLGAVTWGSGTTGVVGVVSATNSLVGRFKGDEVGTGYPVNLSNGNYVVETSSWNSNAGASTWGDGSKGVSGVISAANSLVGSLPGDNVGGYYNSIIPLSNGNYLILSPSWNHAAGAVTWVNGKTGIVGTINATNSLVGSSANDQVGTNFTLLTNGNYVIESPYWNGTKGAVTWGSGAHGVVGVVSAANSLVGSIDGDYVGGWWGVYSLPNGNYVVDSPRWSNGLGAVTFGNGTTGVAGQVSVTNSLVGGTIGDQVGSGGIAVLGNSNYVVTSFHWTNGTATDAGAVTFGNGNNGIHGLVSVSNSLVGFSANDHIGSGGIILLSNNNYLVTSPNWSQVSGNPNGGGFIRPNAGAVTFGSGTTGINGLITTANSIVGPGPLLTTPSAPFPLPSYYYFYYPRVYLDNAAQTFVVTFGGQGVIFAGSQNTGIPAPTLTLFAVDPSTAKYATNSSGTAVAPTIEIANNSGNLLSATIQITGNYRNGQDQLVFTNTSKITGSWNAVTGTLTLTGQGFAADYAAAMASVTYRNLSKTPNRLTRTVSFSTTDGQNVSNTVTRKISY